MLLSPASAQDGAGVAQEPALRNFLLEEYTGIHCSYCPSAHAIAKNLHAVLGSRMQTLAMHVGSLAAPSGDEVDFRTSCGEEWYAALNSGGLPNGSINRFFFEGVCMEGSYSVSRSYWPQVIRSIMNDTAEVNLYAEATLDEETRQLSVRVEYYYPEQPGDDFNTLTVALAENFIRGTQAGGGEGNQYLHQHALRDVITPVWGDTIETLQAGTVMERTYTYTIPAMYNNTAPDLANLEIVAFMSNPKGEVTNSTSCLVLYPGRYVAPSAQLRVTGISKYYARTSIPVRIMNLGTDTLRSVKLSVDWGSETYEPERTDLAIPYGHEEEIWFELGEYPFTQVMKYRIETSRINGEDYASNLVSYHTFWPHKVATDTVFIKVTTTNMASDLSWTLRLRNGEVLLASQPYEDGYVQEEEHVFVLEDGQVYSFEIEDAFLDGFSGGYSITDANGKEVSGMSYVGSFGDQVSFMKDPSADALPSVAVQEAGLQVYPNPASCGQAVNLSFGMAMPCEGRLEVFSLQGQQAAALRIPAGAENASLSTGGLAPGMYLLRLEAGGVLCLGKLVLR